MAFNQDDLYTVSGGVTLYNYWNPFVTKHDASSFYSWEQDNLPSYDLEERTFYLWEKLGYPLSSLPGMALAVSATIPDIAASSNVFTSLQDAIDALPEIIRMPTLIEVAVSGDIGTLHLDNVKCVGTGALEIINRVYAPINQNDSATSTLTYDSTSRSIASVLATSSVVRLLNTSALSLSANTSHLWPGDGVNAPCGGGSFAVEYKSHGGFRGDNVSVNMHDGQDFTFRTGYALSAPDINDGGSDIADGTTDFDLSSFDGYSDQTHLRRYKATGTPPAIGVDSKVNGLISNNRLRSIKVSNCDGPIYIRGFIVDGAAGGASNTSITDWGIKVNNTEGLVIEECGVARAYNGGLLVNNSNIVLNRKFFAGRNYKGTDNNGRYRNESCGIKALNSTINLSSDNGVYSTGKDAVFACYQHHYGIELRNSTITGGSTDTELKTCYNMSAGIRMINSNIEMDGTLDVYSNRVGIDSKGSDLTFDKFVCQYNQEVGIRARNSHIYYGKNQAVPLGSYDTEFDFDAIRYPYQCSYFGNGKHLDLVNSFYEPVKRKDMEGTHRNNIFLGCNGSTSIDGVSQVGQSGVVLHNSKATFLNTLMGQGDTGSTLSDVRSSNYNQLISFPTEGVLVNANSNSNVSFIGTQHFPTVLLGDRYSSNPRHSGVYATNNSNVKFSGPTAIYQFGTGVHVDSGSVLDVSPQKENGILDISSYNLIEPKNHTSFEVHSYTNCLAATNNSTIKLRDLGNANSKYPVGSFQFINSDLNDYSTSAYRHSGGCVFMPNNSENPRSPGTTSSRVNQHSAPESYKFSQSTLNGNPYNYFLGGGLILSSVIGGGLTPGKSNWSDQLSTGGIAVMATDNSVVDVVNVCFHTNEINKDGIYLENDELNECDHLVIWAFARGSSLHAAHLAVSGAYPSEPGYTGPTATYYDGSTYETSTVVYNLSAENNLVSGLPDTSTMSVLDFFGSGVEVQGNTFTNGFLDNGGDLLPGQDNLKLRVGWSTLRHAALGRYGCSSFENSGPFRLYFDTESHARNLVYFSGTGVTFGGVTNDNRPWQTMAQGYMLSGACSSVDISDPVSVGDSYIFVKNYGGGLGVMQTSGYYHTKDAVKTDCSILLDETAANTFANAKHCSMVISERPKLVDIYKSTLTKSGDFFSLAASGAGIRTQRINDPRRTN